MTPPATLGVWSRVRIPDPTLELTEEVHLGYINKSRGKHCTLRIWMAVDIGNQLSSPRCRQRLNLSTPGPVYMSTLQRPVAIDLSNLVRKVLLPVA